VAEAIKRNVDFDTETRKWIISLLKILFLQYHTSYHVTKDDQDAKEIQKKD